MYNFSSISDLIEEEDLYNHTADKENLSHKKENEAHHTETMNPGKKKEISRERKSSFTDSIKNLFFPPNLLSNIGATSEALSKLPKLDFRNLINTENGEDADEDDGEEDREVAIHFNKERKIENNEVLQERYGFEVSIGTPPVIMMQTDDEQLRCLKREKERKFQDQLAKVRADAKLKYVKEKSRKLEKERASWHWTGGHSVNFD